MILEMDTFLGDLACLGQGPDLEAPRVGENGAIPAGESMKSSQFADCFLSGSEPEVIGVTEDNFRPEEPELVRMEGLDRSLSSDRHEYGSLNSAMSSGEAAVSGLGGRVGGKKLEHYEGRG